MVGVRPCCSSHDCICPMSVLIDGEDRRGGVLQSGGRCSLFFETWVGGIKLYFKFDLILHPRILRALDAWRTDRFPAFFSFIPLLPNAATVCLSWLKMRDTSKHVHTIPNTNTQVHFITFFVKIFKEIQPSFTPEAPIILTAFASSLNSTSPSPCRLFSSTRYLQATVRKTICRRCVKLQGKEGVWELFIARALNKRILAVCVINLSSPEPWQLPALRAHLNHLHLLRSYVQEEDALGPESRKSQDFSLLLPPSAQRFIFCSHLMQTRVNGIRRRTLLRLKWTNWNRFSEGSIVCWGEWVLGFSVVCGCLLFHT